MPDTHTADQAGTENLGVYEAADLYEAVYRGRGKDYAQESAAAAALVRDRLPGASRLLDVACGTGSHLRYFAETFADVEGIDLTEEMLEVARRHVPGVPVRQGDMRKFDLGRSYDAITCMFSSVGYLADTAELDATLECFARHLVPGGVAVVEPWWTPEAFLPGYVRGDVVQVDGRTISRVSHSVRAPGRSASRMEVHWVVAGPESGIAHRVDVHIMTLFTRAEYEAAFTRAGFTVEYLPDEGGPGLFAGVLTGAREDR